MILRDLIVNNPSMFYSQSWYWPEPFVDADHEDPGLHIPPTGACYQGMTPDQLGVPLGLDVLRPAVVLAALYLEFPHDRVWLQHYFWTSDRDSLGQRVYVGDNGNGLEIHRHLAITSRWGCPQW